MIKKRAVLVQRRPLTSLIDFYPAGLFASLQGAAEQCGRRLYLVGGALRDWLQDGRPNDLDFVVDRGAADYLRRLGRLWGQGTIVELGAPDDDTCRLVLPDLVIDVAGFRGEATRIEDDLACRDFTINALAVELAALVAEDGSVTIIDPLGGLQDLRAGIVRACPGAFADDPLRMVRAFRFAAQFGFAIEAQTLAALEACAGRIKDSAVERISYECEQIMLSPRASENFNRMASCGLLAEIVPELWLGDGVSQPSCHHLDVLQHNLETLTCLEQLIAEPGRFFPDSSASLEAYLADGRNCSLLKWAALFHDVGKPVTRAEHADGKRRVTFYRHDEQGAEVFLGIAERLHWSRRRARRVGGLIAMHMHPFHLCNVARRDGTVSRRALLKICRRAGDDLAGLFLLAMADSLAGRGADRPESIEAELALLYHRVETLYRQTIRPVLSGPKLLTGNDLIATVGLKPGPLFKELLDGVETAMVEGAVRTREEALDWVRHYLKHIEAKRMKSGGGAPT